MARLVKNPLEMKQPHDPDAIGAVGEIVESNVRGKWIVTILALAHAEFESPVFNVELWELPEWQSIETTSYTNAKSLDEAWYDNVGDALICHRDSISSLIERPILI